MIFRTVAFLVVIFLVILALMHMQVSSLPQNIATTTPSQSIITNYINRRDGFSVRLPAGYIVNDYYRYQLAPAKDIFGTQFTVATATTNGTNLASDTYVSVEQIPNIKNCSAALFLDRTKAFSLHEGEREYSIASSTGAGAGNRYEETVYAFAGTNPCTAVRYFIHYGVIENYPSGTVREFDKDALLREFDAIRESLTILQ